MEYNLWHLLSVVDELVKLAVEFVRWDVYSAFDVPSPVVVVADVYDEIVFGVALNECLELLRGHVLEHLDTKIVCGGSRQTSSAASREDQLCLLVLSLTGAPSFDLVRRVGSTSPTCSFLFSPVWERTKSSLILTQPHPRNPCHRRRAGLSSMMQLPSRI